MNWRQLLNGFQLNNDFIFNDEISFKSLLN